MNGLAARLAALPAEKRALLEKRLRRQPGEQGGETIPTLSRGADSYQATFAQERLWFIEQWEQLPLYSEHLLLRLQGEVHEKFLHRAVALLVARHESLRTSFDHTDRGLRQVLQPSLAYELPCLDLSSLSGADKTKEMHRLAGQEGRRPFHLDRPPLFRLHLYLLEPTDRVLGLTIHHIIFDAWSVGVFFRELFDIYSSLRRGETPQLPPLPVQMIEFAAWQRQQVLQESYQKSFAYWRKELSASPDTLGPLAPGPLAPGALAPGALALDLPSPGLPSLAPDTLDLPSDFPRPPVRSGRGQRHHFTLSPALTERLSFLGRRLDATLFMTLLSAFSALLHRLSAQRRIPVGIPITERARPEWEPVVGLFVNTVVVVADLPPGESFEGLLARVRQRTLMAQAHRDVPFERLVEELAPRRDLSRTPLFQVLFDVQTLPDPPLPEGLSGHLLEVPRETSKFDLYLVLQRTEGGLKAELEYNRDLFSNTTIRRWARAYRTLLQHLSHQPESALAELPLLAPSARHQILVEWNDREAPLPKEGLTLTQLVARGARISAESLAVVSGNRSLTHRALWQRVRRLAQGLQERGLGAEDRVAVALPRGPGLVIALLATLEAGAAYIPLDPDHPAERLSFILEDSQAALLLTDVATENRLPGTTVPKMLLGEMGENQGFEADGREDRALPRPRALCPESLAYVLYTSGSTGRPKGVAVSHGAAVNFLLSMLRRPGLSPSDVFLAVTTVAFDISLLELFGPLAAGARVVLADGESTRDGRLLASLLESSGVTTMQATPAGWQMLLDSGWTPPSGFRALCGGQELPVPLARRLATGDGSLWNLYGPTETTVWSSLEEVNVTSLEESSSVSLGRPLANTHLMVTDSSLRACLPGTSGELSIGGHGLARGYFSRPALTAATFVPDAFCSTPGSRRYLTGDRARQGPDGRVEFRGRRDRQVKIHGFRIEPSEVETALREHPLIREAVVVAAPDPIREETRLVAFVVGNGPLEELSKWLSSKLPAYLIPGEIRNLDALPLTPNAKIDLTALRRMAEERPIALLEEGPEASSPSQRILSDTENTVRELFSQILRIPSPEVLLDSNFFALGGHSLLTTRLLSAVRNRLDADVSLIQFFRNPTVVGLAAVVERLRGDLLEALPSCLVPMQLGAASNPIFWIPPAAGSPLCYVEVVRQLDPQLSSWGLQAPGLRPGETPLPRVADLAAHFIEGLRAVSPQGPYRIAGWSFGAVVAWEMARQLTEEGAEIELLALLDGGMDRWHLSRMKNPLKAATTAGAVLRIAASTGLPKSYQELRTLASWLGISLPSSTAFGEAQGMAAKLVLLRGLRPEIARSLRVLKATFVAGAQYRLLPYSGMASLFRTGDFQAHRDDYLNRLRRLSSGSLQVSSIPGNHMTLIMDPQNVRVLAERFASCLASLHPEQGPRVRAPYSSKQNGSKQNSTGVKT
ncbi:MAG: amino acid adenylation domain-containing protein [Deltaproteobacteria bacterium]|nr:amino acid adenylation domain-containing protein [Deltaproteobacteria bacterium]